MAVELISYFSEEPSKSTQCKFVIISASRENRLVLLGAYEQFPFHAHLVAKFCRDRNISAVSKDKGEFVEIEDMQYNIAGGGWIDIDPTKKIIHCYGSSKAYGQFSPETMRQLSLSATIFSKYQIRIEM